MAKGMDPTMIALLAAGGYGVYAYSKSLWPFGSIATPPTPKTPNYVPAPPKPAPAAVTNAPIPPPAAPTTCGEGFTMVNGACTPSSYNPANPTYCDLNTPGWSLDANGNCAKTPPAPAPPVPISRQMIALAGMSSGLNMDQWCWYFTQATGNDCPVDPGEIDPAVYAGAGIVDRTTPTDIGTWLAIMQNQAPSLGLSGLGDVGPQTPFWMIAAGIAAFMFWGGK